MLKTIKKILIGIIAGLIAWTLIGYFLYFVLPSASFSFYEGTNNGKTTLDLYHLGFSKMDDVLFRIRDSCNQGFINPEIVYDEYRKCEILNDNPNSFSVNCDIFSRGSILSIEWEPIEEFGNCTVWVDYQPSSMMTPLFVKSKITKFPFTPSVRQETMISGIKLNEIDGMEIINITPVRDFCYSNGNCPVRYTLLSADGGDFTLVTEWFKSDNYIEKSGNYYNASMEPGGWVWYSWYTPTSEDLEENFSLKISLRHSNKDKTFNKNLKIIKNEELIPFLVSDNQIIWNNNSDIILKSLGNLNLTKDKTDRDQAETLLKFTRDYMSYPLGTEREEYYSQITLNSYESYIAGEGDSSEFSDVYVMFLRSIGIPTRTIFNNITNYYYVNVYLSDGGWVYVDPYALNVNLGDCSENCKKSANVVVS